MRASEASPGHGQDSAESNSETPPTLTRRRAFQVAVATDGGVVPDAETPHAELVDDDTSDVWSGPHIEYDRYGQPTGHEYVRCHSCGIEVIDGRQSNATHDDDCPLQQ